MRPRRRWCASATDARGPVQSWSLSQIADHAPFGGVVPEIAARAHVELIDRVARRALDEAGVSPPHWTPSRRPPGPGLVGGVMVGLSFGKALALAAG